MSKLLAFAATATILNFTQHAPTAEQVAQGVTAPILPSDALTVKAQDDIAEKVSRIRELTLGAILQHVSPDAPFSVMVGGHPMLTLAIVTEVQDQGGVALLSHSERVSEEIVQPDGTKQKVSSFKHLGWWPWFI